MTIGNTRQQRVRAGRRPLWIGLNSLLACAAINAVAAGSADQNWPQWRGPLCNGSSPTADPPINWSESSHIKWKVKLPGFGTGTPIVWGNKIFIETAIPMSEGQSAAGAEAGARAEKPTEQVHQFVVLCLDRSDGNVLWRQVAREERPHEAHHPDHGYASASPVTDGERVIAFFGSRGMHCYDFAGKLQWTEDLGKMRTKNSFGEGTSPALYQDRVVVNWDDETDNDFIAAFDKRTGKELWRTPRNESTGWSTPLIVPTKGKTEVIVNATERVRSYDLETGKELWQCAGQTANPIPTPVARENVVYVTSGFRGKALFAIELGHTGDLAGTDAILWKRNKNTPYVPSPLLAGDFLYVISGNEPVLTCVDAKTGNPHFEGEKLETLSGIYASPVSARDRVYVLGRNGVCVVLKHGPKLEQLAVNTLEDKTDASIALVGNQLFIRGHKNLYCIE